MKVRIHLAQPPHLRLHLHRKGEANNQGKKSFFFSVFKDMRNEFDMILVARQVILFDGQGPLVEKSSGRLLEGHKRRASLEGLKFCPSGLCLLR